MHQSKKMLAALAAIPASVIFADGAFAADNEATKTATFEIKNDFIGNTTFTNEQSTRSVALAAKGDLEAQIHFELANFTKGFTITYSGTDAGNYKEIIEGTLSDIKRNLNKQDNVTPASADTATAFDTTELYGMFNNMRVKATETLADGKVSFVKLEFSVSYFGTKADLENAKNDHTVTSLGTEPIQRVKAVHDYIIKNAHYSANNHSFSTIFSSGGSSHSYAFWTYVLLKKMDPAFPVEYVYGIANGEYRSWNIVKIGNEWYHLDAAGNDPAEKGNQTINYRYFLTYTENERRIISTTAHNSAITSTNYNYFKTADNLAQSSDAIYYADTESNGEIYKLALNTLASSKLPISKANASTGTGRMVYYKQTSGDTATVVGEYLYFINDSRGKYLYRYNLNGNEEPTLLVKEQIESIALSGASLIYKIKGGDEDFLPLNSLVALDIELAGKVVDAIEAIDKNKSTFKEDVKKARILYMALTEEQKKYVTPAAYNKLLEFEAGLGTEVKLKEIIDKINALDPLNDNYVNDVESAYKSANAYGNQSAIYNYSILKAAVDKINAAKKLSEELDNRIQDIANEQDKNLFNQYEDFIPFIENLLKEYDSLLPSIREVFKNKLEFDGYRQTAAQLRKVAENFMNEVKIIDENSADFFTLMDSLVLRQNDFVASQKKLISSQASAVTQKLALYNTLKQEVAAFKETMSIITAANVDTISLTAELIAKMKAAQQQYGKLKPAQVAELTAEKGLLDKILQRIDTLTSNVKLQELDLLLSQFTLASLTALDGITSTLSTADTAIIEIESDLTLGGEERVLDLLSAKAKENYALLKSLAEKVDGAKALKAEMNDLTDDSSATAIADLRVRYNALDNALKKFFTVEEQILNAQEQRLQNETNQSIVDKLIADIATLSEQSELADIIKVKEQYELLDRALQANVTNRDHLLTIWAKVKAEVEAYEKAIEDVNKAIEALNANSSREEIEKVQEAYNNLSQDQQQRVNNYGKLELLLEALDGLETELANRTAAEKVMEMIQVLNNESTPAEIKAARDAYEALTEEAKKLVNERVLQNLEYFESLLATQTEQAEKEAKTVMDRINRIDKTKYTEAQIKSIRMAYNALSELAKTFVTNLHILVDAENYIIYQNTVVKQAKLDANAFDLHMNTINRNSSMQEIAKARSLYNKLSAEAKRHVTTLEKLVRLETMWNDPQYLELVFTYYPEYVNAVKPGAIAVEKPTYDPLYIPDDSTSAQSPGSVAETIPKTATWSQYETMTYQNGRYTTQITAAQVSNIADRNMRLKAGNIEIIIPRSEIQASTATVGVSVNMENQQLNIQFTEGNNAKAFSSTVEIHVPISSFNANASQIIERVTSLGSSPASFKVDGSNFIIRTTTSGTFKAATSNVLYTDIPGNAQGEAIRELAKRGITFSTTGAGRLSQSYKQVNKLDVATMIASALDISSNAKSAYLDIENGQQLQRAQGLLEAGIMSGATSSRFNATSTMTKQEAAIIIANMYRYLNQDLSKVYNELQSNYRDIADLSFEARQSIAILELFGVVDGTGSFNPTQSLSRGEFAKLFYDALIAINYL
ncbi:hypothetical protein ACTHOQ_16950 [Solibacillus silvestris]|uniref:hypothetical protein n=1 Tax=Solibacillus silvestris TaxID=76853 RepID=UPI003F7DB1B8